MEVGQASQATRTCIRTRIKSDCLLLKPARLDCGGPSCSYKTAGYRRTHVKQSSVHDKVRPKLVGTIFAGCCWTCLRECWNTTDLYSLSFCIFVLCLLRMCGAAASSTI